MMFLCSIHYESDSYLTIEVCGKAVSLWTKEHRMEQEALDEHAVKTVFTKIDRWGQRLRFRAAKLWQALHVVYKCDSATIRQD